MEKIIHVKIKTEGSYDDMITAVRTTVERHKGTFVSFKTNSKFED